MRILINALSARRGGGQTYLLNLLNHLDLFPQIQVKILASPLLKVPSSSQIEVVRIKWPTENPFSRVFWEIFALKKLVTDLKCSVLFCPGGTLLTRGRNFSTAVTFQNMLPFSPSQVKKYSIFSKMRLKLWALKHVLFFSMKRADFVVFISEFAKAQIQEMSGHKFLNSIVVPHGITPEFSTAGKELMRPLTLKKPYLLYVSIFEPYKQQKEVVQAYHHLVKGDPYFSYQLVLAGKNDLPYGEEVKELVKNLNLADRVVLTGNIPHNELPKFFRNAAVNIFASDCENCPNILLEAMGAGRPLACSSTQPMPEFAKDQASYFACHDPKSIADAVLKSVGSQAPQVNSVDILNWRDVARITWQSLLDLGRKGPVDFTF